MKSLVGLLLSLSLTLSLAMAQDYLGCFGANCNQFDPNSLANPFGKGSQFDPNSPNNPFGRYGSPYSQSGAMNQYTQGGPKIFNQDGEFRGNLNQNRYDPNSTANPYGRYGSPYSSESPNNPYTNERYDVFGFDD